MPRLRARRNSVTHQLTRRPRVLGEQRKAERQDERCVRAPKQRTTRWQRTPLLVRWPGRIPAGQVLNGIMSLEDVVPTVLAPVGVPDVKERLLEGYQAGDKQFRVLPSAKVAVTPSGVLRASDSREP
jgi:hypothetical protein